jgi:hypothetical protein
MTDDPPEDDAPPPRLFTPAFWVVIALGALFVAAGGVVALFGPQLLPPR